MADKIRVGLIGMGSIMHWHVDNFSKITEAEIVAIADPVAVNMAKHKKAHANLAGATEYNDYRPLLEKEKLDAVVIASPHTAHYEQIMAALDSGLHVLTEKPMVCRIDQAHAVVKKVRRSGLVLAINYQRHMGGAYRYMRREIAAGAIGKVEAVSCFQCQEWKKATAGTWRQVPKLSGGGQLNDSGSHLVDIMLWVTGLQAKTVSAQIDKCGTPVDINAALSVRFTSGAIGTVTVLGDAPSWWEDFSIVGEKGAFHLREGVGLTQQLGFRQPQLVVKADVLAGGTTAANFVRAIQGKEEPAAPAECGLRVIELTEAAWKSAAQGGKPCVVPRTKL